MPYVNIKDAKIYYDVYGEDHAGRAPIVLIHGSTITGQIDWGERIAPGLADRYKVFVPDCRGHGKSANPRMSYSFKELADDAAEFIRAMGYERAHIIGHSNGGNVALVILMEHPEVVQTCIPQAVNAYVTDYLREREPKVLDPDYVARTNPAWVEEMIQAHAETHGKEYWRDLLNMTMKEIISEPNYSPAELQQVERPTLVIMGTEDAVNAPDRHAQYIAENIPRAELWIPEGIGHNVHSEIPDLWLEKVLDFLERRGSW
jgi:pimeloyl-ACP methyl ester carboxylesterase